LYTQLDTPRDVGCNGLSDRSGGEDGVYGGDIGMVQQILAARTECKRARMAMPYIHGLQMKAEPDSSHGKAL
jgi:hypothetical protein